MLLVGRAMIDLRNLMLTRKGNKASAALSPSTMSHVDMQVAGES